jgi:hypothetical protein
MHYYHIVSHYDRKNKILSKNYDAFCTIIHMKYDSIHKRRLDLGYE